VVERDRPAVDGLGVLVAELLGLGGVDERAEVEVGEAVLRVLDGERVAETDAADGWQVGGEEVGEEGALDDEPGVGGAALLSVVEELGITELSAGRSVWFQTPQVLRPSCSRM
jgi:hypothetical protein